MNTRTEERRRTERRRMAKRRRTMQIIARVAVSLCMAGMIGVIAYQNTIISESTTIETQKVYHVIEVQSGDTLYGIADRYMDDSEYEDAADYMKEIMLINHISDANSIVTGQNLIVPIFVD